MQWLVIAILLGMAQMASAEHVEGSSCTHTSSEFSCVRFLRNYDGDTFTVNIASVHPLLGDQITVRIDGIDAPELHSEDSCERQAAFKAQQVVEKHLASARRIDLKGIKRDKYFRVLATVKVNGKSLAKLLLDEGLAVEYDGGHKETVNWCRR
jgi:micrococcal nuclease